MAIDDNTNYTLTGAQLKDLISRVKTGTENAIRTLTSADYDFPEDNPQYIATWNLPNGIYVADASVHFARSKGGTTVYELFSNQRVSAEGLMYLRIQHDVDYYNTASYPYLKHDGVLVQGFIRESKFGNISLAQGYAIGPTWFAECVLGAFVNGISTTTFGTHSMILDFGNSEKRGIFSAGDYFLVGGTELNQKLSIANLEVGEGLKITTTGSGANTKIKIELDSNDETEY